MSLLKLEPAYKDYIWGGQKLIEEFHKEYEGEILAESWELSCHKDGPSTIANGTYTGQTLEAYIQAEGRHVLGKNCRRFEDFPILVKFIDAKDNLSVQVHPDNGYALKNEGQYGKTEMWYVVDCKDGAFLYYGFAREVSKTELAERIADNTLLEVLNKVPVQKGDVLFIEAGTIHAIGKDIVVAEIQQNSNITYRVYDYGRVDSEGKLRDLHIEKALAVTNRVALLRNKNVMPHLAACDYFTVDKLHLDGNTMKRMVGNLTTNSFVSLLILEGSGIISCENDAISYQKGDSFFLPAQAGEYQIEGICEALVTTIAEKASPVRIAIDMTSRTILMAFVDTNQKILWKKALPFQKRYDYQTTIKLICETILSAMHQLEIPIDSCVGIGVGVPGIIDTQECVIRYSNNICWSNVPFGEEIRKYIPLPVYMNNNAVCTLMGESLEGVTKGRQNVVLYTIGNGVGSAILLNGEAFRGGLLGGSELGHTLIKKDGEQCTCGRKGCLEAYICQDALIRQTKMQMMCHPDSILWDVCLEDCDNATELMAFQNLASGDVAAQTIVTNYLSFVSEGIINTINTFRPDIVVLRAFFAEYEGVAKGFIEEKICMYCFGGDMSLMPEIAIISPQENVGLLAQPA